MCASAYPPISKAQSIRCNSSVPQMNSKLRPEEKLEIIQAADTRRKWHSLDDHRICVLCDRTITGRQIEVVLGPGGTYTVHCPTPGCPSQPADWFYQGNASSGSRPVTHGTREASIWSD
jgi:hypothetical protein